MQNKKLKIHFIGIGGIGVSALARYFLTQGHEVSGSDAAGSEIMEELEKLGAKIFVGHKTENITQSDCVIFSAAVRDDNLELIEARRQGVKTQKYAGALGNLTKEKFTIAISGMHGKSTVTAMIGLILEKAGLDPTIIVGTKVRWGSVDAKIPHSPPFMKWGENYSNFRAGKSQYLVIEADEYDRSFLNYWPKILVLLNIEEEHLDTYEDGLPQIMETFGEYVSHLPKDGVLVANEEDENIQKIFNKNTKFKFKIQKYDSNVVSGLNLKIPGKYNLSNANAALAVARVLGIDKNIAIETLNNFTGTWRRMDYKGKLNGAKIYDDYGHHPTEIKATLAGARELLKNGGRLWCVFQPHQYQRTYELFDTFVGAFDMADKTILLPIYSVAGREKEEIKRKVSSEKLTESLIAKRKAQSAEDVIYLNNFDKAAEYLKKNLQTSDVCVIMGAGDINKLTELLL